MTIPSTIDGYTVTAIGGQAFSYLYYTREVIIPASIVDVNFCAFWGSSSLNTITVDPDNSQYSSVDGILYNKDKSQLLICPSGKIGNINIPMSVTEIDQYAFYRCNNISRIYIPDSVIRMGYKPFYPVFGRWSVTWAYSPCASHSLDGWLSNEGTSIDKNVTRLCLFQRNYVRGKYGSKQT